MFRPWFQVDLKTFIVLCVAVGAGAGIYGRRRPETGHTSRWQIDGFFIDVKWVGWNGHNEFAYLVGYPDNKMGVPTEREGIIIDGRNRTASRPNCRFWICVAEPRGLDVRPVEAVCPPADLSDHKAFETSEFWVRHFRPALIDESQRYDRWWFEKHGTQNPNSRFTSQETWEQWKSEAKASQISPEE